MPSEKNQDAEIDFIPLCVPELRGNEWDYVKECLDTGWVSSVGSYVNRFEHDVAKFVGTSNGVATASGTAALHLALKVAGVQPDDEVLVSTLTFIAPVNAIRYVGAWPVFIDAESAHWQMDPAHVARFLQTECTVEAGDLRNTRTGRRVAAIVPVHILGHSVDLKPILDVAGQFGLPVIEDASESLGALYCGKPVGNYGDMACFSFNGNKLITTGGGGMITTNNEAAATKAKYLSTQARDDPDEYIHHEIGFNYRLTNIQAALGCAQLEHVDAYVTRKREIAGRYLSTLASIPGIILPLESKNVKSSYWLYTVIVDESRFGMNSRDLIQYLKENRVEARPLWQPIHMSRAHYSRDIPRLPVSERLFRDCISLPCSVGLSESQQSRVCDLIRAAHENSAK
jgi:perosamine synthetase